MLLHPCPGVIPERGARQRFQSELTIQFSRTEGSDSSCSELGGRTLVGVAVQVNSICCCFVSFEALRPTFGDFERPSVHRLRGRRQIPCGSLEARGAPGSLASRGFADHRFSPGAGERVARGGRSEFVRQVPGRRNLVVARPVSTKKAFCFLDSILWSNFRLLRLAHPISSG